MSKAANTPAAPRPTGQRAPHIGAFVLETLTLGMYGEPRHTLREYVQNSFDSIRAAQRARRVTGRGRVDITLAEDAITIRDNGLGVRADVAWATLMSIGASKKDRQRDVGFRGIGRLAGMAYCETLTFRTTFPGETVLTTIKFDCTALLKAMDPDQGGDLELGTLLSRSTDFDQLADGAELDDHFFEVTLSGLTVARAPDILRDPSAVRAYLSETAPVPFASDWHRSGEIESAYQQHFGTALETIDVYVHANGSSERIVKPYGETYHIGKTETPLVEIDFVSDAAKRYWAWIGHLSGSGGVTDDRTSGLRVRVRNIQVDGTMILAGIFAEVGASYARFSAWYVGEIYIAPEHVIPNARRDGFEETPGWIGIKHSLREQVCDPLARNAYQKSRARQLDVDTLVDSIRSTVERSHGLADNPRTTYDQVVDLMNSAKTQRRKAMAALKLADDLDDTEANTEASPSQRLQDAAKDIESVETTARMLIGRLVNDDTRMEGLRERLRQQVIREVLDIISAYVDQSTYQQIRRQLTQLS